MYTLASTLLFACCASAFRGTLKAYLDKPSILNKEDLDTGYWIAESTPKDAIFLHNSGAISVVSSIAGRTLSVVGYIIMGLI